MNAVAYAALGASGILALLVYFVARAHLSLSERFGHLQEAVAQLHDDYAHLAPGGARSELSEYLDRRLLEQRRQCIQATNMDRARLIALESHLGLTREPAVRPTDLGGAS